MPLNPFDDKAHPPSAAELAAALGRTAPMWRELQSLVITTCAPVDPEWNFSGASSGWSMRLKHRKRVLIYMTPRTGWFLASYALGEKAVSAARATRLPAWLLQAIETAPRYPEGRGVRFEVRTAAQARAIAKLAPIKLAH